MIETTNKAKRLVSYKMVDEKLILTMPSISPSTQCSSKSGKNSEQPSSSPTPTARGWESGNLHDWCTTTSSSGKTSTPTKLMYFDAKTVPRPQGLDDVVGWQRAAEVETSECLCWQKLKDKNNSETDKKRVWSSHAWTSNRWEDQERSDGDVPQKAAGDEENRVNKRGRLCPLLLGEPQQPQELPGDWRERRRLQEHEMMNDASKC